MEKVILPMCITCAEAKNRRYQPNSVTFMAKCSECHLMRICGPVALWYKRPKAVVKRCPTCKQVVKD